MKNNILKKGEAYQIRFFEYSTYTAYSGTGIYTGEVDEIDGPVYGFKIKDENETCYFPLCDIFEDK